jgi:diaminopimelate epimerase
VAGPVEFTKFSTSGNTFLVVDEQASPLADDAERASFARWALDGSFGVGGADNVIYLADSEDRTGGELTFRIFEHDGAETLSCGNGLLSTAAHLADTRAGSVWRVHTELPLGTPRPVEVGMAEAPGWTWAKVGWPRPVPERLYRPTRRVPQPEPGSPPVVVLTVTFPTREPWAAGQPHSLTVWGLLVFTGEPHLVLVDGHGLPADLTARIFAGGRAASSKVVEHIGRLVNTSYRGVFPEGVHVNFTRLRPEGPAIEHRTYERAINKETLACGTGAVANVHVARLLGLVDAPTVALWPHRCRWYQPDERLDVTLTEHGYVLSGRPRLVFKGSCDPC